MNTAEQRDKMHVMMNPNEHNNTTGFRFTRNVTTPADIKLGLLIRTKDDVVSLYTKPFTMIHMHRIFS